MPNYFSSAGVIDRSTYPDLLNKAIDVVWTARNQIAGNVLGQFFDTDTKDSGLSHVISYVTSHLPLPVENEDTDALPNFTPAPGYDKTITLINYRSGIRVTDTMVRADRFDKIMAMTKGQIVSAARLDEYLRAAIFNNAFTGTAGADSLSLANDSHPCENTEAGTWDNSGTGALSGPNLQALRLLMRKAVDAQGDPDWVNPMTLLVPEDLEQKADELTGASDKPEGMLNDPNVLIPSLKVVVSPYLSSALYYYLIGDKQGYEKGLHEVVLEDWNLKENTPQNADIVLDKRIKAIKAFDFTVSRNVYASTGA